MEEAFFGYSVFWENPFSTLCLFALLMAFVSLWVYRSIWIWGSFLLVFSVLGYHAGIIRLEGFIPLVVLGFAFWQAGSTRGAWRFIWFIIAVVLSGLLWFHVLPGFNHWKVAEGLMISENSLPYTYWIHYDLPFIGIFALAFAVPLAQGNEDWKKVMRVGLPLALIGAVAISFYAMYCGILKWDPKFPMIVFVHSITNFLLVVIPQEAFLRGFIQGEIYRWLNKGVWADIGAVVVGALVSVLFHLVFSMDFVYLGFILISSVVYGAIYQYMKMIEGSILCHGLFNFAHFIFLTFPLLKSS